MNGSDDKENTGHRANALAKSGFNSGSSFMKAPSTDGANSIEENKEKTEASMAAAKVQDEAMSDTKQE